MSWIPDYAEHWVVDYSYATQQGEHFSARAIVHATSKPQALSALAEYLLQAGHSSGQYQSIQPLTEYLAASTYVELPLLRQFRLGVERNAQVIPLDKHNISALLPAERGVLQFTVTQTLPARENGQYRYMVMDATIYRRIMGSFIVPDLMVSNLRWESLFQGETQITLEDSAPYLVELTDDTTVYSAFQQKITQPSTPELGIFIDSDQPFPMIRNHLRKFTYLRNEQQQSWVFYRFYAPQGLLPLLKSLPDEQLMHFMRPITRIGYFDSQTAQYYALSLAENTLDQEKTAPVAINPYLVNLLAGQTQERAVAQIVKYIAETQPELSPEQKKQLPAFVVQQINFACLAGFSHQRSILHLVAGRSLARDNEKLWQRAWQHACAKTQVQELRALICYEYCFKNRTLS
ncbi:DUF4123 domain-containing protein [Xenorhabdus griffiniae]|uniref:DUF4123 domain-containing protein n=1 Tax=Xenorhabdus griffiniae TaxID=351672 RepID=A0ABY9XKA8_9GAMM|nr:DUF4123 domain-containing protein [Xenorhabdus griffiniae]MBD1228484.1 DUF4123 domain-containing protein [Xenorhabdus griffiniae]MBE8588074.1 DUF4123 domain-containing protein [Xenorhabdus griffiniae]WMV73341.1 DUF4123 domain-containing protein [Xenorhabdus griffiniae]WNH03020.1 DUF4123 domain-containing protein [Xenorhabdus griffiniae]